MYDTDANGKVTASDILQVLRDLSGSFLSDKQREVWFSILCPDKLVVAFDH